MELAALRYVCLAPSTKAGTSQATPPKKSSMGCCFCSIPSCLPPQPLTLAPSSSFQEADAQMLHNSGGDSGLLTGPGVGLGVPLLLSTLSPPPMCLGLRVVGHSISGGGAGCDQGLLLGTRHGCEFISRWEANLPVTPSPCLSCFQVAAVPPQGLKWGGHSSPAPPPLWRSAFWLPKGTQPLVLWSLVGTH